MLGFLIILLISVVDAQYSSTAFLYNGMKSGEEDIVCMQGASFVGDTIQLTATGAIQGVGRCLYGKPVQVRGDGVQISSFSTQFIFSIDPGPSGNIDGLAFVIAPTLDPVERASQGLLGIMNSSSTHTFAVEFDTYLNPEYDDPNNNHVGVDVNSVVSWITEPAFFKYHEVVRNAADGYEVILKGAPIRAWIDYDAHNTQINISVSRNVSGKPDFPLISNNSLNLSTLFNDHMYVGFSASTGPLPEVLYFLYSWSFSNNGSAQDVFMMEGHSDSKTAIFIGISVSLTFFTLILVSLLTLYLFLRKKRRDLLRKELRMQMAEFSLDEYIPREFSYKELSDATRGFADKNKLGGGGFGSVFKGVLASNGMEVAVKRISKDSKQGAKEFVAEVTTIGRLRHRNLVPLMRWCKERAFMLVYELMPNRSLDKLLFIEQEEPTRAKILGWDERLNVIRGVASALLYLHEECEHRVVHRDVKASNVLLDKEMNARLGDFGLARFYMHGVAPDTTNVAGTFGYMAPETFFSRKATEKSDVFSFGALLLEVVTGRRSSSLIEGAYSEDDLCTLVPWLWRLHQNGSLHYAVDPLLHEATDDMTRILQLGLLCCHMDPTLRPTMRQVVQVLGGDTLPPPLPSLPLTLVSAHYQLQDEPTCISIEYSPARHSYSSMDQTQTLLEAHQYTSITERRFGLSCIVGGILQCVT